MRRMLTRTALVVSMLLLIATAVIWVRSYWRSDALAYDGRDGHRFIQWGQGILIIGDDNVSAPHRHVEFDTFGVKGVDYHIGSNWLGRIGFAAKQTVTPITTFSKQDLSSLPSPPPAAIIERVVSLPLWSVAIFAAILPFQFTRRTLRVWRRSRKWPMLELRL